MCVRVSASVASSLRLYPRRISEYTIYRKFTGSRGEVESRGLADTTVDSRRLAASHVSGVVSRQHEHVNSAAHTTQ